MAAKKIAKKAKKPARKMVKCRFCGHEIPLWRKSPLARKPESGFEALKRHVKVDHKAEYLKIMNSAYESMVEHLPNELR